MSSRYENIFDQVGDAKPLNNWESNIPEGKHRVALVKYGGKVSGKDKTVFLEAEFIVLSTNNEHVRPGARHSWPWFINKPDEFGYTHARAKDFLVTVQQCFGNEDDVKAFGRFLAEDFEGDDPQAYGVVLDVAVNGVVDARGAPRRGKKGNEVFNATWMSISQDDSDIASTRATLAELASAPVTTKPAAPPKKEPEPVVTPPNGKKLGGLGTLLGRKM